MVDVQKTTFSIARKILLMYHTILGYETLEIVSQNKAMGRSSSFAVGLN